MQICVGNTTPYCSQYISFFLSDRTRELSIQCICRFIQDHKEKPQAPRRDTELYTIALFICRTIKKSHEHRQETDDILSSIQLHLSSAARDNSSRRICKKSHSPPLRRRDRAVVVASACKNEKRHINNIQSTIQLHFSSAEADEKCTRQFLSSNHQERPYLVVRCKGRSDNTLWC